MTDVTRILARSSPATRRPRSSCCRWSTRNFASLPRGKWRGKSRGSAGATALVHEACLRLMGEQQFENRGHFFAAAAEAMRRILVERARRRTASFNAGEGRFGSELLDQASSLDEYPDLVLSLQDLLARLEQEDKTAAKLSSLHLFGGLSVQEAAEVMGLSRAAAYRNWKFARAWLRDALEK